jgi:hypothetical protein
MIPFKFGIDVDGKMTQEEINYIHQSLHNYLNKKYENYINSEKNLKEAFEYIILQKNESDAVIKHKL